MLAYCDELIHIIQKACNNADNSFRAKNPKYDLHIEGGYLLSTKKTMIVMDKNGKEYLVTVNEI